MEIGTKVMMVRCEEAKRYRDRVWITTSEPWLCSGQEVVKLDGWSGGFSVDCLKVVEDTEKAADPDGGSDSQPDDTYELAVYREYGITSDKAREWGQAEREGRLVITPPVSVQWGHALPKATWDSAASNIEKVAPVIARILELQNGDGRGKEDAADFMTDMQLAYTAMKYVAKYARDKCRIIPVGESAGAENVQ